MITIGLAIPMQIFRKGAPLKHGIFHKSISARLNIIILAVIVCLLTVFTAIIVAKHRADSLATLKSHLESSLDVASVALEYPLYEYDQKGIDKFVDALFNDVDVIGVAVVDSSGALLFERRHKDYNKLSFNEIKALQDILVVNKNVISSKGDKKILGNITLILSTRIIVEKIRSTRLFLILFGLFMLTMTGLAIYFVVAKNIKIPVETLRMSAYELSHGNLDATIDNSRVDELGNLASSFDVMRNSIRKKINDLQKINQCGEDITSTKKGSEVPIFVLEIISDYFKCLQAAFVMQDLDKSLHIQNGAKISLPVAWIKSLYGTHIPAIST